MKFLLTLFCLWKERLDLNHCTSILNVLFAVSNPNILDTYWKPLYVLQCVNNMKWIFKRLSGYCNHWSEVLLKAIWANSIYRVSKIKNICNKVKYHWNYTFLAQNQWSQNAFSVKCFHFDLRHILAMGQKCIVSVLFQFYSALFGLELSVLSYYGYQIN